MYNHKKEKPWKKRFFNVFFLVIDETSLTKTGRRLMARMLTRPCTITPVDFTIPHRPEGYQRERYRGNRQPQAGTPGNGSRSRSRRRLRQEVWSDPAVRQQRGS